MAATGYQKRRADRSPAIDKQCRVEQVERVDRHTHAARINLVQELALIAAEEISAAPPTHVVIPFRIRFHCSSDTRQTVPRPIGRS
jgi:hypothetical protein